MARGKHRKAAEIRRAAATDQQRRELEAELAVERERVAALEARAGRLDAARTALVALLADRDERTRLQVDAAEKLEVRYREAVLVEERAAQKLQHAWDEFAGLWIRLRGGGVEGWEALATDIGLGDLTMSAGVDNHGGLGGRRLQALQRARGYRRTVTGTDSGAGVWILDYMAHRAERSPTFAERRKTLNDHMLNGGCFRDDRNVALAWASDGLTDTYDGHGVLDDLLGAVDATTWAAAAPSSDALSSDARAATAADAAVSATSGRWKNPYAPRPLHMRPSDAVALRWWYRFSASGDEAALDEGAVDAAHAAGTDPCGFGSDALDDDKLAAGAWPDTVSADAVVARDIRTMLAASVIYWLPPGTTAAYAAGEAPDAGDLDGIRLGYRNVMVTFAEPVVIDRPARAVDDDIRWEANRIAATARSNAGDMTSLRTSRRREQDRMTFADAAEVFSNQIDAVVVESDADGRPTGRVVWCVSLVPTTEDATVARTTIPGLRDRCGPEIAQLLDVIVAVTGWGAWIGLDPEPGDGATPTPPPERNGPLPALRVLAAHPRRSRPGASTGTGRGVATHLRRGHWRRQHHGPGGRDVKMVWIGPTVVGSIGGRLVPQVYRLRVETPENSASG